MSYTVDELEKIYKDSCNHNLNKNELQSIKNALYILTPVGKFNSEEYAKLIKILKGVPKYKLDNIEDFKELYTSTYKDAVGLPDNHLVCNYLLNVLFTDYSMVTSNKKFKSLSNDIAYVIPCIINENSVEIIGRINKDLKELLTNSFEFFRRRPNIKESFGYACEINTLFEEMMVTFLINKKIYDSDYSLPSRVIIDILNNRHDSFKIMKMYFNTRNTQLFIKALFNVYIKQNGTLFEKPKVKSSKNTIVS